MRRTREDTACGERAVVRRGLPDEWSAFCTRDAGHAGQHVALDGSEREILRWPPDQLGGDGTSAGYGQTERGVYDTNARAAILAIEAAGTEYADAVEHERRLEHYRPRKKTEAIARIMATENPETHKQHSASSAEKIVETDDDFWEFCADQRDAAAATIRARARFEAARRTADLEIALVQASTQVLVHSGG